MIQSIATTSDPLRRAPIHQRYAERRTAADRALGPLGGVVVTFIRNLLNGRWRRSGVEALSLVLQPLLGVPAVVAEVLLRCLIYADQAPRTLTVEEKMALSSDFPLEVLERTRLHAGDTSWVFRVTGFAASAQAIGYHIYLRSCLPDPATTLRHELVHVLQYRDCGGIAAFLSDYFAQMLALWVTGKDYYRGIRQEEEAYTLQS